MSKTTPAFCKTSTLLPAVWFTFIHHLLNQSSLWYNVLSFSLTTLSDIKDFINVQIRHHCFTDTLLIQTSGLNRMVANALTEKHNADVAGLSGQAFTEIWIHPNTCDPGLASKLATVEPNTLSVDARSEGSLTDQIRPGDIQNNNVCVSAFVTRVSDCFVQRVPRQKARTTCMSFKVKGQDFDQTALHTEVNPVN